LTYDINIVLPVLWKAKSIIAGSLVQTLKYHSDSVYAMNNCN